MNTSEFEQLFTSKVERLLRADKKAQLAVKNNPKDKMLWIGADKFRKFALDAYCEYVEANGTDHGLAEMRGRDMEKTITRNALSNILDS